MHNPNEEPKAILDSRRNFLKTGVAGAAAAMAFPGLLSAEEAANSEQVPSFELDEVTVVDLQKGLQSGKFTARALAEKYLQRIDEINHLGPSVNAVIELNPEALAIADQLDAERKSKGPHGPLHGIPVLIKDNIATADRMQTTAGSLALVGARVAKDSHERRCYAMLAHSFWGKPI